MHVHVHVFRFLVVKWQGQRLSEYVMVRRGSRNLSRGVKEENFERKMFLMIHESMRVHIKTRHTFNSFSPFQEDCILHVFVLLLSFIF